MTRTTITAVANAIKAGVQSHYSLPNRATMLERIAEVFLDMAVSLEMESTDPLTGLCMDERKAKYAALLDGLSSQLDPDNAPS